MGFQGSLPDPTIKAGQVLGMFLDDLQIRSKCLGRLFFILFGFENKNRSRMIASGLFEFSLSHQDLSMS
jgi:hypothetical protein